MLLSINLFLSPKFGSIKGLEYWYRDPKAAVYMVFVFESSRIDYWAAVKKIIIARKFFMYKYEKIFKTYSEAKKRTEE